MGRTTKADINSILTVINNFLISMGKTTRVKVAKIYDYYGVDTYFCSGSTGESTLFTGTLKECLTFLKGMESAITLSLYSK